MVGLLVNLPSWKQEQELGNFVQVSETRIMVDEIERLVGTEEGSRRAWKREVLRRAKNRCANCGSRDRVKVQMLVPKDAGGEYVASNGFVLCRTCELAKVIGSQELVPLSGGHTRPVNFFVSSGLHARLSNGLVTNFGFKSVSALVRYLIDRYVDDPDRYEDVSLYQDGGSDVKINVWVDRDRYARFKELANGRKMTVTDTLKGLIRMHEVEARRVRGRIGK